MNESNGMNTFHNRNEIAHTHAGTRKEIEQDADKQKNSSTTLKSLSHLLLRYYDTTDRCLNL